MYAENLPTPQVRMQLGHAQYILWVTDPPMNRNCSRLEKKVDIQAFFIYSSFYLIDFNFNFLSSDKKKKPLLESVAHKI